MYISRDIEKTIKALCRQYAIITITGPRQTGKTTLVKRLFPEKAYFNLESPDVRETVTFLEEFALSL
ncbi:AAA family ATPase [candidate division KSB1 bacterium]|nr:AAA family ATPase [candidate division KSB1 bacterium]